MKQVFTVFLLLTTAVSLWGSPISPSFGSIDYSKLPVEVEKVPETDELTTSKMTTTETASLFNSTYAIVLIGLIGIYLLLIRKRESGRMNL